MNNKKLYWILYWVFDILFVAAFVVGVMLYLHYKVLNVGSIVCWILAGVFGWLGDIQEARLQKLGEL